MGADRIQEKARAEPELSYQVVSPLLSALSDPEPAVRIAALRALVQLPLPRRAWIAVADAVLAVLEPGGYGTERSAVLAVAGRVPTARVRRRLAELLDELPGDREPAVDALVTARSPVVVPWVVARTRSVDRDERIEAARKLAVIGLPEEEARRIEDHGDLDVQFWLGLAVARGGGSTRWLGKALDRLARGDEYLRSLDYPSSLPWETFAAFTPVDTALGDFLRNRVPDGVTPTDADEIVRLLLDADSMARRPPPTQGARTVPAAVAGLHRVVADRLAERLLPPDGQLRLEPGALPVEDDAAAGALLASLLARAVETRPPQDWLPIGQGVVGAAAGHGAFVPDLPRLFDTHRDIGRVAVGLRDVDEFPATGLRWQITWLVSRATVPDIVRQTASRLHSVSVPDRVSALQVLEDAMKYRSWPVGPVFGGDGSPADTAGNGGAVIDDREPVRNIDSPAPAPAPALPPLPTPAPAPALPPLPTPAPAPALPPLGAPAPAGESVSSPWNPANPGGYGSGGPPARPQKRPWFRFRSSHADKDLPNVGTGRLESRPAPARDGGLSPDERGPLDERSINFWVEEPETGFAAVTALEVGRPYRGCFRVGAPVPGNLLTDAAPIPATDIPASGLETRWEVWSRDVELIPPEGALLFRSGPAPVTFEAVETADGPQWQAAFDLTIPRFGDSELRTLGVTLRTDGSPALHARVFARGDLYRELTVTFYTAPTHRAWLLPHRAPKGPSTTVDEVELLPAEHTGVRIPVDWFDPLTELRLSMNGNTVNWELETTDPRREDSEAHGTVPWKPAATVVQRIAELRSALKDFREEFSDLLDDVEPADLVGRLARFEPCRDWSAPVDRADERHRRAWEEAVHSRKLRRLGSNGRALYLALFPAGTELNELVGGLAAGDRLRIVWYPEQSERLPHVPWALLYTGPEPTDRAPVEVGRFLGMRLRAEHQAHRVSAGRALGESEQTTRAHLLYWGSADGDITAPEARVHRGELRRWTGLVLPSGPDGARAEVREFLTEPGPSPVRLVYAYCQAAGTGSAPRLRFGSTNDPEEELDLSDLRAGAPFPDRPLVFLNACGTSAAGPGEANELEEVFFERGCRVFIGTEGEVPIRLAARLAEVFFHFLYLRPDGHAVPAGEAMVQARRFLWDEYRNPGGLFYNYVNDYKVCVRSYAAVSALR
ncbi:CHAT domain-containing protein [Kitasatospora sp. NPDC059722]|uniref:CHAT domain-containing protein n=1 Tax=unclassified Kitasatospora TaxID=2633591 RepID=UPI00364FFDAB